MGKTAKGALWVASDKTSVYDFYQYWYNVQDKDVEKLLRLFTRIPLEEISKLIAEDIRIAKKRMAFEITKLIHGEEEAIKAQQASENLFNGGQNLDNVPTVKINKSQLPISLVDLVAVAKLVSSKSEGRRMIEQGAVSVNGDVKKDFNLSITESDFEDSTMLLKKGKKNFIKVVLE